MWISKKLNKYIITNNGSGRGCHICGGLFYFSFSYIYPHKMKYQLFLIVLAGVFTLQGQNLLDDQGRKTGHWKIENPSGTTLYEARFQEGKPVGEMIRYYENGAIRASLMFDSLEDKSFTRLFYKSGKQAAEGWHINKAKDSVWTYFSEFDGTVRIREPYQNGVLSGIVRSYYPGGLVSEEVNWLRNLKNGDWKQFYEDGSLRLACRYENDKLTGAYDLYYPDSTLKVKGAYLDNHKNDTWRFFGETGSEVYFIEYLLGKVVDQEKYLQIMADSLKRYELINEPEINQHF